ncbi:MAG: hypothetical protein H0U04_19900 [Rubrobacter sp.]|nr:hypothetical protein [Rubrobacter sp.]
MAEALQFGGRIDLGIWHKDSKDEDWERGYEQSRRAPTFMPGGKKRGTSTSEARRRVLLRAAAAVAERENLDKYGDALAGFMGVSREQLYSMSLIEFVERYDNALFTEEINAAYDEELEQEDEEFLAHVKGYQGRVLDSED